MKKLFVFLLLPFSSFAILPGQNGYSDNCSWEWIDQGPDGQGGWVVHCSGVVEFTDFIAATNKTFVEECENAKSNIIVKANAIIAKSAEAKFFLSIAQSNTSAVGDTLDALTSLGSTLQANGTRVRFEYGTSEATGYFLCLADVANALNGSGSSNAEKINDFFVSNAGGVYAADGDIERSLSLLDSIDNDALAIKSEAASITCASSSSGGSCQGSDCPCEEYWQALLEALRQIQYTLDDIYDDVNYLRTHLWRANNLQDRFGGVHSWDYIYHSLIPSYGQYKPTNDWTWYLRIEALLASLAGYGNEVDDRDYDHPSEITTARDRAQTYIDGLTQQLESDKNSYRDKISRISLFTNGLNPFRSLFNNSFANNTITLLPDIPVTGASFDTFPQIQVELSKWADIITVSNMIFIIFWSVLIILQSVKFVIFALRFFFNSMQSVKTLTLSYFAQSGAINRLHT